MCGTVNDRVFSDLLLVFIFLEKIQRTLAVAACQHRLLINIVAITTIQMRYHLEMVETTKIDKERANENKKNTIKNETTQAKEKKITREI